MSIIAMLQINVFILRAMNPWSHKFKNSELEMYYFIVIASKLKKIFNEQWQMKACSIKA